MLNKAPTIYYKVEHFLQDINGTNQAEINGRWVPARPMGMFTLTNRFKAAWMAFTGKGDIIVWPEGQ